ncbi:MAG TPA: STAS domain-containing protein [Candidatus Cybelea sp.]|jgi:anti-anti-sigma factor
MQCVNLQPTKPETLDVFVVDLVGEFDLSERDRLMDAFGTAKSARLVFANLAKTSYMDSTALECLVHLHAMTRMRGAAFILLGVQGTVQRLFEICDLDKVFDIRSTLSDLGMASITARRLTVESRARA